MKKKLIIIMVALMMMLAMGMTVTAADKGWSREGDNWVYYNDDGSKVSGWKQIGSYWYYFNPEYDDTMVADDWIYEEDAIYYFDGNGHMVSNKWVSRYFEETDETVWWYYDEKGHEVVGWKKIGSYWYYFDPVDDDIMSCDRLLRLDGKWYCFDEKGHMLANKWVKDSEYDGPVPRWYYFTASGAGASGWQKVDGYWYYFRPEDSDAMESNNWVDDCYFVGEDGRMVTNKWIGSIYDEWWYFKADGKEASGWEKIGNYWYYFEPECGNMMVPEGWYEVDGTYYHFDEKGRMSANKWIEDDGDWWYCKADGKAASGWEKIGDYWYYFDPECNNIMVAYGCYEIDGVRYGFDNNGRMMTNKWLELEEGVWVYLKSNGKGAIGWEKIGSYWYYFDPGYTFDWRYSKIMVHDCTMYINEVEYKFDSNGRWIG